MNIIHLEASSGWGGQEMRILKEAEGMRAQGHFVILSVMTGGKLVEKGRAAGFQVYELNFKKWNWLFCLASLLWIFWRHKIDLVNTHSSLDSWIGGIAARLARVSVVRTRHLSTPIKPGLNSRILYGKLADFVVTTCASIVPMIVEQSGKPITDVCSIATGVDPKSLTYSSEEALLFREKLSLTSEDFLVGTACVMRSWKGIGDLLEAAHLLRDIPHLHWVVIGGGHSEIHHRKAKELGLEGIVHFTGHLDQPFPAIGALDCFTLLSTANEGVSQAILQAAYLKKPLIATETGGLKEVCIHRETGLSVPTFHPAAVAEAVLELKGHKHLRDFLGANAHRLVADRFILQNTLDQMNEVYRKVVNFS